MLKAISNVFYFGAIYDVAVQGGEIGIYKTGLFIPEGMVALVAVQPLVQCVGPGSGFAFGVAGDPSRYGAYSALSYGAVGTTSVSLNQKTSTGGEVLISIVGAVVATGKIKIHWTLIVVNGK